MARALLFVAMCCAATPGAHAQTTSQPRQIAPDIVAPPALNPDGLTREQPRAPLSAIGPAGPPKPKKKTGPNLFRPLATAAGIVEANGLTVTVAGIDVVGIDEICTGGEREWPCGLQARTAFRGLLRGRAVTCDLPPDKTDGAATVACKIGKLDVGAWLVANGWARPAEGGPYAEAGEKAKAEAKGIFGGPPDLASVPVAPAPFSASSDNQTILEAPVEAPTLPSDSPPPEPAVPTPVE